MHTFINYSVVEPTFVIWSACTVAWTIMQKLAKSRKEMYNSSLFILTVCFSTSLLITLYHRCRRLWTAHSRHLKISFGIIDYAIDHNSRLDTPAEYYFDAAMSIVVEACRTVSGRPVRRTTRWSLSIRHSNRHTPATSSATELRIFIKPRNPACFQGPTSVRSQACIQVLQYMGYFEYSQ